MSSKSSSEPKKNVVIVGGGLAGIFLAFPLSKKLDRSKYDIVLVNARPFCVNLIAALRMVASDRDKLENSALIPYDKFDRVRFVEGTLTTVEPRSNGEQEKGGTIVLKTGERVEYAALVLATGSRWSGPLEFGNSEESVKEQLALWRQRIATAAHIVIGGGGALGIEAAGEIKEIYPEKKVTIVHTRKMLLKDVYPDKFRLDMERRVRAFGIDYILEDRVETFPEPGKAVDLRTRNGKIIPGVDLVIPAFGSKPNTEFLHSLGDDLLTERGYVKVHPTLELVGQSGIFAAGDIVEWPGETKHGSTVRGHGNTISSNIVSFLNGKPLTATYKGTIETIVVNLGKFRGGGYFDILWGVMIGDWLSSVMKGKKLMVERLRGMLGY